VLQLLWKVSLYTFYFDNFLSFVWYAYVLMEWWNGDK
jgi:hypothetical protein